MREKKVISKELIEALNMMLNGQEEGFNIVYKETYNYVWNRCRMIMGNDDDAMELLQEVYIAFYNSIEKMENANNVFGWLKTACYYQHTILLRKKKEVLLSEDGEGLFDIQETVDSSVLPGVELEQKETIDIIKSVVEELLEEQRAVITAYYYDEMSVKEIAESLNVSDGTVKSRLNYARKHIKEAIEEQETKMGIKLHSTSVPALILAIRSMLQGYSVSGVVMESSYAVIGSSLGFATGIANTASQVTGVSSAVASTTEKVVEVAGKETGKNILKGMIGKTTATKIVASVAVVITLIIGGTYIASQQEEKHADAETVIVADEQNDTNIQVDETGEETSEQISEAERQDGEDIWDEDEWVQIYRPLLEEFEREYLEQGDLVHGDHWISTSGYEFVCDTSEYCLYDMNNDNIPELLLGYNSGGISYSMPYEGAYSAYGVFTLIGEEIVQLLGMIEGDSFEKCIGDEANKIYLCEDNCIIWACPEWNYTKDTSEMRLLWKSESIEDSRYNFLPTGEVELIIKVLPETEQEDNWKEKIDDYFAQHRLVKLQWKSISGLINGDEKIAEDDKEEYQQVSAFHVVDEYGNVTQYSEYGEEEWTTNVYEILCDKKLLWGDRSGGKFIEDISMDIFPSLVYDCQIYQEEYIRVHVNYGGADWGGWNNIYLDPETGAFVKEDRDIEGL